MTGKSDRKKKGKSMPTIRRKQTDAEKAVSKKAKRSRQKGIDYERELVRRLKERGFTAERGLQMRGGGCIADVTVYLAGDPWLHVEAKKGKRPNAKAALGQAIRDAAPGVIPVAVTCEDAKSVGGYRTEMVTMRLSDWIDLVFLARAWISK